jgi:hypothetical protein
MDTRKRLEFNVPGASVLVIERHHSYERGWNKAPRMYVDASEQFNVIEDLMNRHRRPYATWRKAVRKALAGVNIDLSKMAWSQKAGCSCPCSPGFVLESQCIHLDGEFFRHFDIWVTLVGAPSVDETKVARDLVSAI